MPKFYQGAGPLGRDVAFTELSAAAQLSTPQVIASGTGTTTITGNGAAQTVFSDTFTALTAGEMCEVIIRFQWNRTAGAGTPNVVTKLGATTIHTDAAMTDGVVYILRGTYAPTFGLLEQNSSVTPTGTAAQNIVHNAGIATIDQISVKSTQAAATNGNFPYSYHVIKYKTGV